MRRFLLVTLLVLMMTSVAPAALAADETPATILPDSSLSVLSCERLMVQVEYKSNEAREAIGSRSEFSVDGFPFSAVQGNDILACAIKTGNVKFWMVPFFIRYILQFILGIAGIAAMGGIVYGGFLYLFAGLSDDKEKGKKAILYGIIGFVLTLTAWAIVNIVIALVT